MKRTSCNTSRGLTLIELMVTLAVLAILAVIVVPGYQTMVSTNRQAAGINALSAQLSAARSEALKRGHRVTVCSSTDGATCNGGTAWEGGWIAFTDLNGSATIDGTDVLINAADALATGQTLTAQFATNGAVLQFHANGTLRGGNDSGTFVLCGEATDANRLLRARSLIVNPMGRVSIGRDNSGNNVVEDIAGNDVACP